MKNTIEKILIIGANGQVGKYLYQINKDAGKDVISTTRKDIDLYQFDVNDLYRNGIPDVIYLPAAMTNVDYCEINPAESRKVNVDSVIKIVNCIKDSHTKLVFYSSDYVFDGKEGLYTEDSATNPINEYGKQKLEAERYIQNEMMDYLIIRTSVVYSLSPKSFVGWVIKELSIGNKINVCTDEWCTPTSAKDLAAYSYCAIDLKLNGLYHIAGLNATNKYSMARIIAKKNGLDVNLINPITSKELNRPALRPLNAGLDCCRFGQDMGYWPSTGYWTYTRDFAI